MGLISRVSSRTYRSNMSESEEKIPWKVPRTNKVPGYWDFDYYGFRPFPLYKSTRYWDEQFSGHMFWGWAAQFMHPFYAGKGDDTLDILDMRGVGMPMHALKAMSFHYAARCNKVNNLFALAKSEFQDPRSTLRAGRDVSLCAEDTVKFTLKNCRETFTEVARCLEKNPTRMMGHCRPEQFAFDKCMHGAGQDKQRLAVYEQIIEDEDVPWTTPKNPRNYRVVQVPEKKRYDPLKSIHEVPDNDAFRDFLKRKEALEN